MLKTTTWPQLTDVDDAYSHGIYIKGGSTFPPKWVADAEAFRTEMELGAKVERDITYATGVRNKLDWFLPDQYAPKGLFVFVHGGYWLEGNKEMWSHCAKAAVAHGWAAAVPGYTLTPKVRVSEITREIAKAVEFTAGKVKGPIIIAGHSAGGHLVSRMMCEGVLSDAVAERLQHVVSVSGVHDLRPLVRNSMNRTLKLDLAEAEAESPALLTPIQNTDLTCLVGALERPDFLRQNLLLANIWTGFGIKTRAIELAEHHHFNIIDVFSDPKSELATELFG